jgi:hypothetical protein
MKGPTKKASGGGRPDVLKRANKWIDDNKARAGPRTDRLSSDSHPKETDNHKRSRRDYAAPMARRCWKHSRQKTGRPCVGRKGTVVSFPHCEQLVLVSARMGEAPPPTASARLALQALHRLGSFLKPLSAKNICSPAVNTNSAPHSEHFKTLSWYSMEASPWTPEWVRERADFARRAEKKQQGPAWSRVCNKYNLLISDTVLRV